MRRTVVAALAVTGALVLGPAAAQAAPVTPYHAGHDHGSEPAKPKPKPHKPKPKDEKKKEEQGHSDGSHASGGYDSHRSHEGP